MMINTMAVVLVLNTRQCSTDYNESLKSLCVYDDMMMVTPFVLFYLHTMQYEQQNRVQNRWGGYNIII